MMYVVFSRFSVDGRNVEKKDSFFVHAVVAVVLVKGHSDTPWVYSVDRFFA